MGHLATTKPQLGLRKTAAIILLVVALFLLFMPWVYFEVTIWGNKYDLTDLLSEYDLDMSSLADELEYILGGYDEYDTISRITEKLDSITSCLRDSKFSPLELARVSSDATSIISSVESTLGESYGNLDSVHGSLLIASILLWTFSVAAILLIIYDIYAIWNDDTGVCIPAAFYICIYFGILIVALIASNSELSDAIGISGKTFFHFNAVPFACVVCVVGSLAVLKYLPEKFDLPRMDFPDFPLNTGWTCDCGKRNKPSAAFCADCGKKRVDFSRCESCGAPLSKGSSFCAKCGTPVNRRVFEPICPSCGKELKTGTKFCIYCGAPINSDAAPEVSAVSRTSTAAEYSRPPEIRRERHSDGGYTPTHAKTPREDEPQSSGRLKIKKSGDVEYK